MNLRMCPQCNLTQGVVASNGTGSFLCVACGHGWNEPADPGSVTQIQELCNAADQATRKKLYAWLHEALV